MMVGDRKGPPGSIWRLPGYGGFFLAATLGRVADEMLAIAVVLLVLDRTSSPALAGATVAAASLPSVLTGPVLGAWLDRTRHRRAALAANQVLLAAALLGMLLAAGRAPAWVVPALAVVGGIGAPMLTGGITSMIPLLVPPGLLSRANALEAASFNSAAVLGPALAGTHAGAAGGDRDQQPGDGGAGPLADRVSAAQRAARCRSGRGRLPLRGAGGGRDRRCPAGSPRDGLLAGRAAGDGRHGAGRGGHGRPGAGPELPGGRGGRRRHRTGGGTGLRRPVRGPAAVVAGSPPRPGLHHRREPEDRRLRHRRRRGGPHPGRHRPPRRRRDHRRRRAAGRPHRPG